MQRYSCATESNRRYYSCSLHSVALILPSASRLVHHRRLGYDSFRSVSVVEICAQHNELLEDLCLECKCRSPALAFEQLRLSKGIKMSIKLDRKQRERLTQFQDFTGADKNTAIACLKAHKWSVDIASYNFFEDSTPYLMVQCFLK